MAMDTALILVSLLSFAALLAVWIAAPLRADDATQAATEPVSHTVPA